MNMQLSLTNNILLINIKLVLKINVYTLKYNPNYLQIVT